MSMGYRCRLSGLVVLITAAAGCTGHTGGATAGPTAEPVTTSVTPLATFGTRQISLDCSDATWASTADTQGMTSDSIPFAGFSVQTQPPPPRAEDVGVRLPAALHWYFRKQPLAMLAGAPDFTVAVSGPGQALAWVPVGVWTSSGHPDLTSWAASSVTLHSCPDHAALFLGGVLAADPAVCLHLGIRPAGRAERTVRQHLDGTDCAA
jgi:hypothetical protein